MIAVYCHVGDMDQPGSDKSSDADSIDAGTSRSRKNYSRHFDGALRADAQTKDAVQAGGTGYTKSLMPSVSIGYCHDCL